MNIDIMSSYLAAMIDGEGSILYNEKKYSRSVAIYNTETEILEKCSSYLNNLGVVYGLTHTGRICKYGESRAIYITGRLNLKKLYSIVSPYMCNRKKNELLTMLLSYKYGNKKGGY